MATFSQPTIQKLDHVKFFRDAEMMKLSQGMVGVQIVVATGHYFVVFKVMSQ